MTNNIYKVSGNINVLNDILLNGDVFIKRNNGTSKNIGFGPSSGESNQGSYAVAVGSQAGQSNQGSNAVAVGLQTGYLNQGANATAIGRFAGATSQGLDTVAIGNQAAQTNQKSSAVAVGNIAGFSNQGSYAIAVGYNAGTYNQSDIGITIGHSAGTSNQKQSAIGIGYFAGESNQGSYSVAIGDTSGRSNQGLQSIAVGRSAGRSNQGSYSVAVGNSAGLESQSSNTVAIGNLTGQTSQGSNSVAIGTKAGFSNQGSNSVAIGRFAGESNQGSNSIILNATGTVFQPTDSNGFFVKPILHTTTLASNVLAYTSAGQIIDNSRITISSQGAVNITGSLSVNGAAVGDPAFIGPWVDDVEEMAIHHKDADGFTKYAIKQTNLGATQINGVPLSLGYEDSTKMQITNTGVNVIGNFTVNGAAVGGGSVEPAFIGPWVDDVEEMAIHHQDVDGFTKYALRQTNLGATTLNGVPLQLSYDNSPVLTVNSTGVDITGSLTVNGEAVGGGNVGDPVWFNAYNGDLTGTSDFTGFLPWRNTETGSVGFTTATSTSGTGGYFTAPVAGPYHFSVNILHYPASDAQGGNIPSVWFAKNGNTSDSGDQTGYGYLRCDGILNQSSISTSATVYLDVGDTMRVRILQFDLWNIDRYGSFSGYLIGSGGGGGEILTQSSENSYDILIEYRNGAGASSFDQWLGSHDDQPINNGIEVLLHTNQNELISYETSYFNSSGSLTTGSEVINQVRLRFTVKEDLARIILIYTSLVTRRRPLSGEILIKLRRVSDSTILYTASIDDINQASGYLPTSTSQVISQTRLPLSPAVIDVLGYARFIDKTKITAINTTLNDTVLYRKSPAFSSALRMDLSLRRPNYGVQVSTSDTHRIYTESLAVQGIFSSVIDYQAYLITTLDGYLGNAFREINDEATNHSVSFTSSNYINTINFFNYDINIVDTRASTGDYVLSVNFHEDIRKKFSIPTNLITSGEYTKTLLFFQYYLTSDLHLINDSISSTEPRIYPPAPFPNDGDNIRRQTRSYTFGSPSTYGLGTYTISMSEDLYWSNDFDIDTLMNEGNLTSDPTNSANSPYQFGSAHWITIPAWFQIQMPVSIRLKKYKLVGRIYSDGKIDGYEKACPRDWKMLGSSDGVNWKTLDIRRDEKFYTGDAKIYEVNEDHKYNYFKFYIERNNGHMIYQMIVTILQEIVLWGVE